MKRAFFTLAAFAALISCTREQALVPEPFDVEIIAGTDTKVILDGSVKWEDGDRIALVFNGTLKQHISELNATIDGGGTSSKATFSGTLGSELKQDAGCNDLGYAVYPYDSVLEDGTIGFALPSVQTAEVTGSFAPELNLASAVVSLSDLTEDGKAEAQFRNALSALRFTLSQDVTEVTITGTSPLAGKAPLVQVTSDTDAACGRFVIEEDGSWTDASSSVTLKPAGGADCFADDVTYNVLIWPGTHSSLTITQKFKNLGNYERTASATLTFEPSKYYKLNFNNTENKVIVEYSGYIGNLEDNVSDASAYLDEIDRKVISLISQIQSVALKSEYLDNAVFAPYANFNGSLDKQAVSLSYVVRPASAAAGLVQMIADGDVSASDVMSAVVTYRSASGTTSYPDDLPAASVTIDGDVMTVSFDATNIPNDFYKGYGETRLMLNIFDKNAGGSTDILSEDAANLVPQTSAGFRGSFSNDIPVPAGATVSIPFSYAVPVSDYTLAITGQENVGNARLTCNKEFKTGYLIVDISETVAVSSQKVVLTLTFGETALTREFTFVEGGQLVLTTNGRADYIGGEVTVKVERNDFGPGNLSLDSGNDFISQSVDVFTCAECTETQPAGSAENYRCGSAKYTINNGGLTYTKYVPIEQYYKDVPLQRYYYPDGCKKMLDEASMAGGRRALNIVILGDGYMQKDLTEAGKFERDAVSAMDNFFGIEPYKSFRDRFNVYMVAYASNEEGIDNLAADVDKDTYFNAYWEGGNSTYSYVKSADKVVDVVKNVVGLSTDEDYYRTIAILLVNSSDNFGSTGYPGERTTISSAVTGDGYASFGLAVLPSNSTGFGGLVKHEAGGHAFGRLGDEYGIGAGIYNDIENWHGKGWYLNICRNLSYWSAFTDAGYSSSEVDYVSGRAAVEDVYVPTSKGMMSENTGSFNAPSRWYIYDRIRKQSEGYGDYWSDFLEYDKKNR